MHGKKQFVEDLHGVQELGASHVWACGNWGVIDIT